MTSAETKDLFLKKKERAQIKKQSKIVKTLLNKCEALTSAKKKTNKWIILDIIG